MRWALAAIWSLGALGSSPPATWAAPQSELQPSAATPGTMPLVAIEEGRVTIDARDAELADVLGRLAALAEFELRTKGDLGKVTTTVTSASVERALQQLVQGHELMLVYSSPGRGPSDSKLVQVGVFAASVGSPRSPGQAGEVTQATAIAEIAQLVRAPNDSRSVPRLVDLLRSADPTIRGRAAWGLGRIGGPATESALSGALRDVTPEVRIQAVYAFRGVDAARAVPALAGLLANDPNARVRRAAAQMLGTFPGAASALAAASGDSDRWVRREVARSLQRLERSP